MPQPRHIAVIAALAVATGAAAAKLSWFGDPGAPDISGVWLRDAAATAGSKEGWTPWPPPLKSDFAARWQESGRRRRGRQADR